MFLRSLWNPNALKYMLNNLLYVYTDIILTILSIVIIIFLAKFVYKLIKKTLENKKNKKNKKESLTKKNLKEIFLKEKSIFRILKFPIIWSILIRTWWAQISVLFHLFSRYYDEIQWDIIRETLPLQESWVLWMWATYSLWFFIIAWYFIWLSFGNKMIRNIWILIYILWILFYLFVYFLDYWSIVNDLPNFTV